MLHRVVYIDRDLWPHKLDLKSGVKVAKRATLVAVVKKIQAISSSIYSIIDQTARQRQPSGRHFAGAVRLTESGLPHNTLTLFSIIREQDNGSRSERTTS